MRDEHLAGELVLASLGDGEVDLDEGIAVAVEDRRRAVLLQELDVLEPVQVLARGRGVEVDVLDERDVLLVREAAPGEELRVDRLDLLGLGVGELVPWTARHGSTARRSATSAGYLELLLGLDREQPLDLGQDLLLGLADRVGRSGERHARHGRGLDRQRRQILGLERVDVRLPARAGEHLQLHGQRRQEVVDALGCLLHDEALAQLRILRRDPDGAPSRVAVVALPGRHADRALVVRDAGDLLVAVERHQRRVAERDRLRAEREALRHVRAVPDAACDDEVDLVREADVLERAARLGNRGHERDAGLLGRDVRARAGAALAAVEVDDVRPALGGHAHVVVHARGAELELDRHLVVGRLADLLDLQREVVRPEPVRVPRGRALVDPGRERAHLRDLLGHLLAHQMPAEPDLAALADEELDPVREHQVVRVEPVPALDHLVVPLGRVVALGRDHPALARAGRRARHRRALRERHLGLEGQRPEATCR